MNNMFFQFCLKNISGASTSLLLPHACLDSYNTFLRGLPFTFISILPFPSQKTELTLYKSGYIIPMIYVHPCFSLQLGNIHLLVMGAQGLLIHATSSSLPSTLSPPTPLIIQLQQPLSPSNSANLCPLLHLSSDWLLPLKFLPLRDQHHEIFIAYLGST